MTSLPIPLKRHAFLDDERLTRCALSTPRNRATFCDGTQFVNDIACALDAARGASMKCRLAILSTAFLCFGASTSAFANTLVVDNDFADCPQADYTSIHAAVLAAEPGDKILVCPGIYPETVLVNKPDLRIEAQAAPGDVVLHGTGTPVPPFGFHLLNTTGVLVQGFTVQGFSDSNIRIEGGSGNTLRKNITTATPGSGIRVINSSANVVERNTSFANQGA